MARPARPERSRLARSRQLSRFYHSINPDRVFGTHTHDNILVGTAYIRELHDHCGVRGFLAAYSAGTGRHERHLATGRALPDETLAYVAALAPIIEGNRPTGRP